MKLKQNNSKVNKWHDGNYEMKYLKWRRDTYKRNFSKDHKCKLQALAEKKSFTVSHQMANAINAGDFRYVIELTVRTAFRTYFLEMKYLSSRELNTRQTFG